MFLDFIQLKGDLEEQTKILVAKSKQDSNSVQVNFMKFIEYNKEKIASGEKAAGTIVNYYRAFKLFCDMNDIHLNWKKISKGLPRAKKTSNDRAPTIDEIRKLIAYPDRRIKSIVFVMCSSGIRLGAWDYLKWKHVIPQYDNKGEILAAKLIVYDGEPEQYYTFLTPEAYASLKDWMDFRASFGEVITGGSFLMRDLWQTTNTSYGARWGLATSPKRLESIAIKRLLFRALVEQGVRTMLPHGVKRYEWKGSHGYRKFFKSRAEQVMRPANVEMLMGHDFGISESYWRPTESSVLEDYIKAVDLLTIEGDEKRLRKKIEDLKQKSKENNYIIEGKLAEKDIEIKDIRSQLETMQKRFNSVFEGLEKSKDQRQINNAAKLLYDSGIIVQY